MNIKSLMIGDYVQMKVLRMNKVFEKESIMMPYKVVEVRERLVLERINIMDDDERYTTIFTSNIVEPIPLTKKILEKNGFEDFDSYATLDTEKYRVIYAFDGFLTIVDDDNQRKVSYLECDYVHQLQQVLRLCGINKEIVL